MPRTLCTSPDPRFTVHSEIVHDLDPDLSDLDPESDNYAGSTPEDLATYRAQDAERLVAYYAGDWSMLGVRVTVSRHGVELAQDSLYGIESDSGADYLAEVIRDLTSDAIREAKDTLAKLCACEHN